MVEKFIVKVAVEQIVYHLDKPYDYAVSDDLADKIKPGCRVLVPFGAGNKKRQGVVLTILLKFYRIYYCFLRQIMI